MDEFTIVDPMFTLPMIQALCGLLGALVLGCIGWMIWKARRK